MDLAVSLFLALTALSAASGLIFRSEQFKEVSPECKSSDGKPLTYILNEANPALYVSVDPYMRFKAAATTRRRLDSMTSKMFNLGEARLVHDLHYGDPSFHRSGGDTGPTGSGGAPNGRPLVTSNATFDCVLQVQTELPKGDKSRRRSDALSLMVVQLAYGSYPRRPEFVQVSTFGHRSLPPRSISKPAQYTDRLWAAANPNFLLSGQLSGFDSIDYRTKVDHQHLVKPEKLQSTFDKPASIKVNLTRWNSNSHVYLVFTSYKYLRHGERCQEHKEFDCVPPAFLASNSDHLCMSQNLACDGLPNCGQDFLPNQDENCFKIHWSSILLSLVSYILLAITLLLCLSCFARVIIQWSVRSSIAEIRGGAAIGQFSSSPTGSFRSSSRFFSFLGSTFASRWERPPPTYDEAMKHVNPDLARPAAPPAYSDSPATTVQASGGAGAGGSSGRGGGGGTTEFPPYSQQHQHCVQQHQHHEQSSGGGQQQQQQPGRMVVSLHVRTNSEVAAGTPPPEYERSEGHATIGNGDEGDLPQQQQQQQQQQQPVFGPSSSGVAPFVKGLSPPPNLAVSFGHTDRHPAVVVLPPTPLEPGMPSIASMEFPPPANTPATADQATATSPPPMLPQQQGPASKESSSATRVVEAEICQTHL